MRPLKLTMTAFGAYAGRETINFEELGNERIFVISGKTGAGKSTIFDAISYAIFGRSNTFDREGFSMRSHFAEASEMTQIELTFLLRQKKYYIKRTPQQEIAKKRGSGTTTLPQKAVLYELQDDKEILLASSVRDVNIKMEEIIQLNVHQFRQILMIPQGEFRELLVSESKEKEVILQRLAHTVYYKNIEEKLFEKQKQAEIEVKELRAEINQLLLESFADEEGLTDAKIEKLFTEKIAQLIELEEKADQELTHIQKEAELAIQQLAIATQQLADFEEFKQVNMQLAELKKEAELITSLQHRLTRQKRAEKIRPLDDLCKKLTQEFATSKTQYTTSQMKLEQEKKMLSELEQEQSDHEKLAETAEKWRRNLFQFEEMESNIHALAKINQQEEEAQKAMIQKENNFSLQENEYHHLISEQTKNEQALAAFENLESKQLTNKMQHDETLRTITEVKKQLEQKMTLNQLEQKKRHLIENHSQQMKKLSKVAEQKKVIEQAFLEEQAYLLSKHLVHGEACPVCGGLEHPHPAVKHTLYSAAHEKEINEKYAALQLDVEAQTKEIDKVTWQIDGLADLKEQSLETLQENLKQNEQTLKHYVSQKKEFEKQIIAKKKRQQALAQIKEEVVVIEKAQKEALAERNKSKEEHTKIKTKQLVLEENIPAQLRDLAMFIKTKQRIVHSLKLYTEKEQQLIKKINLAKEKQAALKANEKQQYEQMIQFENKLSLEEKNFQTALSQAGFNEYDDFKQSLLTDTEITEFEARIESHSHKKILAENEHARLQKKLESLEKPNIEELEAHFATIKQIRLQKEQLLSEIKTKHKETERQQRNYQQKNQRRSEAEEKYRDIGLLADVARGKNERRITFERYVLATFLDTIVRHANTRLAKMTNGRFWLHRKDEKARGNAQSGLELEVYDEYTGLLRHVKTLSGGECFKASLALALALAEVVQEMAGGISLETMFIDEGFGTLDPESLDMAVECLLETQEKGRIVGIISHVPELKERIPSRLEVTATNHGSKAHFIVPVI
ncbi:AAA family ATPase [Listeria sp. PSOL-1]|uniref:SbcC/MukB-like Walker B domain-containing protein n=1 Tax=Listeria sp. PSOL-1 TaxID=1844999 RepID=UPI0013D1DA2B|nr:SMC family ATPase [Listeria sp. PSOL-1]